MYNISGKENQQKEELFQVEEDHIRGSQDCSAAEAMILMCEAIQAHKNGKK